MGATKADIKSIFGRAMALSSSAERAAFLQQACGGDAALRAEIESLLRAARDAGSFLGERSIVPVATVDEPAVTERPGTVIGPYKLLEQIGEGGMGLVFVAEQQQPVRRKVALKVIKPGMDTRQVVARFEAERQALALMDHPHIAKVHDGGATASGRPYFVMELARGVAISEFCDHNQVPVRARLELFLHVCQAVQHAHQKGIIHRDLKPSNVLVVSQDGTPAVKVIDFGVAKAVGQQLTDKTLFTGFAQMVGTPLYMSPEQAGQSGVDVDTRADIYALGVLLYELLTGTTPLDKDRLKEADYDELRRIIQEEEPSRPSARVSTLGQAATTVSSNRRSDPKQLSRLFRGELDWIVMRALEKDRTRRYETASAFAADVQHYLNDEPVQACPPSAWYRFRKFARRNKVALATACGIGLALLVGVIGLVVSNVRVTQEKNQKDQALGQARANLQKARQAVDDYFTQVSATPLLDTPGLEPLRKQLLDTALNYYQDFIRQYGDDPQLQADVAAAHLRVSQITYMNGGSSDHWFPPLREGVEIIGRLVEEHRDTPEVQKRLTGIYLTGSDPTTPPGGSVDLRDALRYNHKFVQILEKFARDNPGAPEFERDVAGTCYYIAALYGANSDGLHWADKSVKIWEKLARGNAKISSYRMDLARAYNLRAGLLKAMGRGSQADEDLQQVLDLREGLAQAFPGIARHTAWLAASYRTQAELQQARKDLKGAEKTLGQALALQQKLVAEFPSLHTYQHDLAQTQLALARVLKDLQRPAEAEVAYRQALGGRQELVAHFPGIPLYRDEYVATVPEVSSFLAGTGKAQDGTEVLRHAILFCQNRMESPSLSVEERSASGEVAGHLAARMRDLGQAEEANKLWGRTIALFEKLRTQVRADDAERKFVDRGQAKLLKSRGEAYAAQGQWAKALAVYARVLELDPSDDWHWLCATALQLHLGDVEGYRRTARDMLRCFGNTDDPTIAHRTAITCLLVGDAVNEFERVLKLANLAVEKNASERWFLVTKGLAEYRAGHHAGSVDWLKRVSPRVGGTDLDSVAFTVLAMSQHRLGRAPEARAALGSAEAILADELPDPKEGRPFRGRWDAWLHAGILCREAEGLLGADGAAAPFRRGAALKRQGKAAEAAAEFQAAIRLRPNWAEAHFELGWARFSLFRFAEVVAELQEAIRLRPDWAQAHFSLGQVHELFGQWAEAAAEFQATIRLRPDWVNTHDHLGGAHAHLGQWDKALAAYVRQTELNPSDHGPWYWTTALQLHLGDVDGYRRTARDMLQRFGNTDDPGIRHRTAITCLLVGDAVKEFDGILKLANLAVEKDASDRWNAFAKGLAEYRAGHHAGSVDWLKRLSRRVDGGGYSDCWIFAVLAMSQHRLGRAQEARAALGSAQALLAEGMPDPREGRPFGGDWHDWLRAGILCREAEGLLGADGAATPFRRGAALRRQGKAAEAAAQFQAAIRLRPDWVEAHVNLGQAHAQLGQWDKALPAFVRLTELDPSDHMHWYLTTALQLHLGDVDGYRRTARGMLQRFGKTDDPTIAHQTALTCLLVGDAVNEFDGILKLANLAVAKDASNRWFLLTKGLAEYRAGNHAGSVDWLQRVAPRFDGGGYTECTAFAVLAMGQHRLGRAQEARAALGSAQALLAEGMPDPKEGRPFGGDWHDWLRAGILCREAEGLLGADGAAAPFRRGAAFRRQGKAAEAAAQFQAAIRLRPDWAEAHRNLGGAHAQLGQWDKALPAFVRLTQLDPGDHVHWYCATALQLHLGDVDGYRRTARDMLKRFGDTDDPWIADRTAITCLLVGDAVNDFDRVLKLANLAVEKNASERWFLVIKGLAEYRAGHYAGSVYWLKRLSPRVGGGDLDCWAFAALAMSQHRLGRAQEARAALGSAEAILAESMPNPGEGRPFGGNWHDWLRAGILCREAEGLLGADGAAAPFRRGAAFRRQGKWAEAAAEFEAASRLRPDWAEAHYSLGQAHAQLGQWDKAAGDFSKGIGLHPDDVIVRYWHALACLGAGDLPGYRSACAKMLEHFGQTDKPDVARWVAWTIVLAPDAVKDWDRAVQLAETALRRDSKSHDCLTTLGATLYRAGRFEPALQRLEDANAASARAGQGPMQSSPAYAWFFLAMTHQRQGHPEQGRKWLDKAIKQMEEEGKNPSVPWNGALTLQLLCREAESLLGVEDNKMTHQETRNTKKKP
jgi:tetratricopeptide (TPR) repeat protein/serine/threonine protein kinase